MKIDFSKHFWKILIVIILMILFGGFSLMRSIRAYQKYDLNLQDKALENIVNSVDSTLADYSRRYIEELKYVTGRKGFLLAEEAWRNGEGTADLHYRLQENLLCQDELIDGMIAVVDGQIIASTNGKDDFWIPVSGDNIPGATLMMCSDEEMKPYIAFVQFKEDITYAAIVDPVSFYEVIEKSSGLKAMGDMILTDKDHSMFMYRNETKVVANLLNDEGDMENPLLHILLYAHMNDTESVDFYEVKEGAYEESYQARVAICPDNITENKFFTIGIVHNEEEQAAMLHKTTVNILIYWGIIILAIMAMIIYLLWIYQEDSSNRKEIEELKAKKEAVEALNAEMMDLAHHQRLETIGQLTSGVAHEFNNLLTPIMGYSLMTIENLPPEDVESYDNLLEIYEASQKAKELISRLSDLSRKNNAVSMHYVNPNEIVKKAISMVNSSKPKQVILNLSLRCKEVWLYGNETQLTQMLMNLLLNAFHAMEDEKGEVFISDYVEDDRICFEIEDSGKGMSPEVKKKIFEPFYTTKEKGRGTGLGLAIVMQTIEEHKGKIKVESEEGKGSTFYLSFPIVTLQDEETSGTTDVEVAGGRVS